MRNAFVEQLDSVIADLVTLNGMVQEAVRSSTRALMSADASAAQQVIAGDVLIDRLREQIEEECFELLALQQPVASDLRTLVAAVRMVSDLERMGDLAVHVAKVAQLRVPEAQARDIRAGQAARIDLRGQAVPGRVRRVHPIVEQGTVLVEVVPAEPLPAEARIDQSVEGTIDVEMIPKALFVARPIGAQPSTSGAVFRVAADDDLAHRVPVRFGPASVGEITIVSGLAAGDRIVVSDLGEWATRDVIELQ